MKVLAAMANTVSGLIVLGVDDKSREILGIPHDKPDVLARLFQQRSQARLVRFDEQIVPGTSSEDLNPRLWQRFKTVLSPRDDMEFLEKMRLISKDEEGILRATVGGVLMASDRPEDFLSGAFIQAVCYRGTERNGAYQLDAKDFTGPLDIQIRDACMFVERNTRVYATKAPNRIETPQFSMNAVFEAVVNAAKACLLLSPRAWSFQEGNRSTASWMTRNSSSPSSRLPNPTVAGLPVDPQLKHIRAGVVPRRVKVEGAAGQHIQIGLSLEHPLSVIQGWSGLTIQMQ